MQFGVFAIKLGYHGRLYEFSNCSRGKSGELQRVLFGRVTNLDKFGGCLQRCGCRRAASAMADRAVRLGGAPAVGSYLNIDAILRRLKSPMRMRFIRAMDSSLKTKFAAAVEAAACLLALTGND